MSSRVTITPINSKSITLSRRNYLSTGTSDDSKSRTPTRLASSIVYNTTNAAGSSSNMPTCAGHSKTNRKNSCSTDIKLQAATAVQSKLHRSTLGVTSSRYSMSMSELSSGSRNSIIAKKTATSKSSNNIRPVSCNNSDSVRKNVIPRDMRIIKANSADSSDYELLSNKTYVTNNRHQYDQHCAVNRSVISSKHGSHRNQHRPHMEPSEIKRVLVRDAGQGKLGSSSRRDHNVKMRTKVCKYETMILSGNTHANDAANSDDEFAYVDYENDIQQKQQMVTFPTTQQQQLMVVIEPSSLLTPAKRYQRNNSAGSITSNDGSSSSTTGGNTPPTPDVSFDSKPLWMQQLIINKRKQQQKSASTSDIAKLDHHTTRILVDTLPFNSKQQSADYVNKTSSKGLALTEVSTRNSFENSRSSAVVADADCRWPSDQISQSSVSKASVTTQPSSKSGQSRLLHVRA